jgi:3-isopropylmalate dehydratase small subunit
MNPQPTGRAWVFGDKIDTDVLAPGHLMKLSAEDLATHCLEAIAPDFARTVRPGDVIVAGRSFGIGSSREQAAVSLKILGVRAILAVSYARIFWRNALNLGLPALTMEEAGEIRDGDLVAVDPASGRIENATSLMTTAQIVSYVDRYLPTLVLDSIKTDLGLSDFQLGLLLGPAFVFFYLVLGIPIGRLADRASRRGILAAGVTIWCCMTALGGFARNFPLLLTSRLGVGLSVFMTGTFLGAGLAFLFGGPLVHAIEAGPPLTIPGFATFQSWRLCFFVVGLPGLVLALAMLTVREPARLKTAADDGQGGLSETPSLMEAAAFMLRRWRAFGTLFIASGCNVTLGSLALWNIALFKRVWGWNVGDVGLAVGALLLTGGSVGTLIGVRLTSRAYARGRRDATLWTLWVGLLIDIPAFALYGLMPNASLGMAVLFLAYVGQAVATAAGPAALAVLAPGQIRSSAVAVFYLTISIASQLLGPPIVGWLADRFHDPMGLRYAIFIEAITVGIPASILVARGLRYFRLAAIDDEARAIAA